MNFLQPKHNVWRIERANRAAVLIDAAAFFEAVRGACLKAERSILVVGWDIDSRTPARRRRRPAGRRPSASFADFLSELVRTRPGLHVHLLLWDYSLLYAGERELLAALVAGLADARARHALHRQFGSRSAARSTRRSSWSTMLSPSPAASTSPSGAGTRPPIRPRIRHRVDPVRPSLPALSRRPDDGRRRRGAGAGALARERWCRANGGVPHVEPLGDPWPDDGRAGLHRRRCRHRPHPAALRRRATRCAKPRRCSSIPSIRPSAQIYIENQFLTSPLIADRLAERLRQQPELEVVIVAPRTHDSWVERHTMRNGRIRFWRCVHAAGGDRVRLLYPAVEQGGKRPTP